MGARSSCFARTLAAAGVISFALTAQSVGAEDHVNPNQAEIDALKDETALLNAKADLAKAQAAVFPALTEGTGKNGTLTVETAERDKFHVTARAAESFKDAAKKLAAILKGSEQMALLTDADRNAMVTYKAESAKLVSLASRMQNMLGPRPPKPEALGLVGVASLLTQVAQFTKLFRTDKSLAFTEVSLPDELLLDMLVVELPGSLLYPAAALDAVYAGSLGSAYANGVREVADRRAEVAAIAKREVPEPKDAKDTKGAKAKEVALKRKEEAVALLAEIDALATALATIDTNTKLPALMIIMRGELAEGYVQAAQARVLAVRVEAKGGSSLKTSSIWRSDRLYAAGGVVVSYRVTNQADIVKAGIVTSETKFVLIPLDTR